MNILSLKWRKSLYKSPLPRTKENFIYTNKNSKEWMNDTELLCSDFLHSGFIQTENPDKSPRIRCLIKASPG